MNRGLIITGALLLVPVAPAAAAWAPGPEILSVDNARREQADGPSGAVDLSDDGRYLVFQTRATNFFADDDPDPAGSSRQGGIFRADRTTGALALVADGPETATDGSMTTTLRGATNPSVSADGRFVVFSTAQALVPEDSNVNVDVYVRDMDVPLQTDRQAGSPYELVSALDATDRAPTYEATDTAPSGGSSGSDVFPGAAISADGRYVAFRTQDRRSDLAATGPLQTPPTTVFVRDRLQKRTVVVSRAASDGSAVSGAQAPVVISADGSTVAWVGAHAQQQTRFLDGEVGDDSIPFYLWRHWAEPGASTRRVTGSADPDDPACPPGGRAPVGPTQTGPCAGPLTDIEQGSNSIAQTAPALSADGRTVAFLSGASTRPSSDNNPGLDAFVTDMSPGVSRKAGTRQITLDTTANNAAANGELQTVALSADGRHLAFTTARTVFLLRSPTLVGPQRGIGSPVDLYVVDLAGGTMERAVFGPGGVDANGPVLPGVSLSPDGSQVGYLSGATNLLVGDANQQPDAFVSRLAPPGAPPVAIAIRPRTPPVVITPPKPVAALKVRASTQKDGSVDLRVTSGQPGLLRVVVAGASGGSVLSLRKTFAAKGTKTLALELTGKTLVKIRRGRPLSTRAALTFTPTAPAKVQRATVKVVFRFTQKQRRVKKA